MVHPHIIHYEVLSLCFDSFVPYHIPPLSPFSVFAHSKCTLQFSGSHPPHVEGAVCTFDTEFLLEKPQGNRITWETYIAGRVILKWTLEK